MTTANYCKYYATELSQKLHREKKIETETKIFSYFDLRAGKLARVRLSDRTPAPVLTLQVGPAQGVAAQPVVQRNRENVAPERNLVSHTANG